MAKKKETRMLPRSKGKLGYTTSNVFRAPLKKVWEAVVDPKHLKKYFVDGQDGTFGPGLEPVTWTWKEWGGWTFYPVKFEKEKEIVFLAPDMDNKCLMTIRFEFLRKDGRTIFRVHEMGYKASQLKQAFMMCEGWTEFHTGLKAYIKFGADLRKA